MARVASPTFVGRAAELSALDAALDEAAAGQTTTVLIAGDAGVGKTRLLQAWSDRARHRGARIAAGSCLDLGETGPAYTAVVEALRELFRGLDSSEEEALVGSDRNVLARIVPELGHEADLNAIDLSGPNLAQTRLFDRIVELLLRASATGPVVLEIEDIHWADQSSQAFMVYLVEVARDANLLLIGTYRPEAADSDQVFRSTLGQLLRRPRVATLTLPPFDEGELREQLAGILGAPPSNALLAAIHARSEGNALFAEELAAARDPSADLPASVAAATTNRAEKLSEDARSVLRVASVVGRTAGYDILRQVSGLDDAALARALREAVRARLVEPVHVGEGYRFRHALIQDAIYEETLPGERRRLHASVAGALSGDPDRPPDDPDLAPRLARHWYEAREFDRAFLASHDAAEAAAGQAAYAEAAAHYERMVELWDRAPEADRAMSLAATLERAAWNAFLAGDLERCAAHLRAALDELATSPDARLELRVLNRLAWAIGRLGHEPWDINRRIAAMDPDGLPSADRLVIETHRVQCLEEDGDRVRALELAGPLLEAALAEEDPDLYTHVGIVVAELVERDNVDEALRILEVVRSMAFRAGDRVAVTDLDLAICGALLTSRSFERLEEAALVAIELAGRAGLGRWARPFLRYVNALGYLTTGRLADCLEQADLADADVPSGRPLILMQLVAAQASIATGDFGAAADHLERARLPDATPEEELGRGWLAAARAQLALAERRYEDVQRTVDATAQTVLAEGRYSEMSESVWWLAEVGLAAAAERSEAARAADDRAVAADLATAVGLLLGYVDSVRAQREEAGIPLELMTEGYEALINGHIARIEGRDTPSLWEKAASEFPPRSVEALTARYQESEAMLAARASRDGVREVMAPAHATAVEIGARPLAAKFEALARRARIELAPEPSEQASAVGAASAAEATPLSPGHAALRARGLSDREIEVLTLVAAGRSNSEIAERLFITSKTASVHVSHILMKLNASSRVEAATIGVRLGLAEIDPAEA